MRNLAFTMLVVTVAFGATRSLKVLPALANESRCGDRDNQAPIWADGTNGLKKRNPAARLAWASQWMGASGTSRGCYNENIGVITEDSGERKSVFPTAFSRGAINDRYNGNYQTGDRDVSPIEGGPGVPR